MSDLEVTVAREFERVPVASASDVPVGSMKAVEANGRKYVVFNVDGSFHALLDSCPHQGAPLSCGIISGAMLPAEPGADPVYGLEGKVVVCPWHRWKFSIETGESLFSVDRRSVPKVRVEVEGDQLLLVVRASSRTQPADEEHV